MNDKFSGQSMDIEQADRDKLQSLFPQCFVEGKLDIDKLLNLCGEYIDNDFEKYKFEWSGKAECYRIAGKRSTGTLRPCEDESVNWDTTHNLYIEGDNLEVLKLLQTAYFRKVKLIYIDPPYNTGHDFVYEDDFRDPISRYKEVTQQTTKSNPETMGRYHTNWLNMMFPRLRLAANLLRDDGVIFISIDDGEQANMRKLCDEVFGEENFRNCIAVRRGIKNVQAQFESVSALSVGHEYIYLYSKQPATKLPKLSKSFIETKSGKWDTFWRGTDRPTMRYDLFGINPDKGQWRWEKSRTSIAAKNYENYLTEYADKISIDDHFIEHLLATGEKIDFVRKNEEGTVQYYIPPQSGKLLSDNWMDILLSGTESVFDTEKSVAIIDRIVRWVTSPQDNDIILDFFSGSATTAHAVMQLNAEDGGNRRFICVQLPEVCDEKSEAFKVGYKNICEIGKERIRRAGAKILAEQSDQVELGDAGKGSLDVGFRCFKLDSSNLVAWDATPISDGNLQTLWDRFDALSNTLKAGRSDMDIVFEVMLKMGVPLDFPVLPITVNDKKVYSIGEDAMLLCCLDSGITPEDIEAMCDLAPAKIIAAEEGFADDTALSNAHYILKDRDIEMKLL
ncbi:site-specific DNA-methyltransferase [Oscillospiraceae bacterium OttesenSCG-928-G22]|nr:site-specific DNA-methyltransferase [Oscillospiraceae bacterium OttesenSCG-928-G22]